MGTLRNSSSLDTSSILNVPQCRAPPGPVPRQQLLQEPQDQQRAAALRKNREKKYINSYITVMIASSCYNCIICYYNITHETAVVQKREMIFFTRRVGAPLLEDLNDVSSALGHSAEQGRTVARGDGSSSSVSP